MRSEAVAKRVRRHPFVDSGFFDGAMQSGLENTLVHMVTMKVLLGFLWETVELTEI